MTMKEARFAYFCSFIGSVGLSIIPLLYFYVLGASILGILGVKFFDENMEILVMIPIIALAMVVFGVFAPMPWSMPTRREQLGLRYPDT